MARGTRGHRRRGGRRVYRQGSRGIGSSHDEHTALPADLGGVEKFPNRSEFMNNKDIKEDDTIDLITIYLIMDVLFFSESAFFLNIKNTISNIITPINSIIYCCI